MIDNITYEKNRIKYLLLILGYLSVGATSSFMLNKFFGITVYTEYALCVVMSIVFMLFSLKIKVKTSIVEPLFLCRMAFLIVNVIFQKYSYNNYSIIWAREAVTLTSMLVYLFAYNFISKDRKEINIIAVATSLIIVGQFIVTFIIEKGVKRNIGCFLGDHNYACTVLIMLVAYLLFSKTNIFAKIVAYVSVASMVLVQSFGASMIGVALIVIYLITKTNWKNKLHIGLWIAGFLVAVGLVLVIWFVPKNVPVLSYFSKKLHSFVDGNFDTTASGRKHVFRYAWESFLQNPIFGNLENNNATHPHSWLRHMRTHNHLLESLVIYGIVGTILNVAILGYVYVVGIIRVRQDKTRLPLLIACTVAFIQGFFDPNFLTVLFSIYFYLFAGALVAPAKKQIRRNANEVLIR